jgi:hypothetical protein
MANAAPRKLIFNTAKLDLIDANSDPGNSADVAPRLISDDSASGVAG